VCRLGEGLGQREADLAEGRLYPTYTKPIGAFLKYISKQSIPAGISSEHSFEMKKGYSSEFGSGRYVVAKDSTGNGGNDNPLVLWDGFGSQTPSGNNFNIFKFDGA
jgi:hypothetical protein